ncbi:hypothetical protein, partial [Streptomyces brasiliscabiei]|uniref:hypothetical protein n=1 Tax=Streptomyces brasiliscabiei TaxID=2736302 RepID=UPI0030143DAD
HRNLLAVHFRVVNAFVVTDDPVDDRRLCIESFECFFANLLDQLVVEQLRILFANLVHEVYA